MAKQKTPKRQWYDVHIRDYQILCKTEKAMLVAMPAESKFAGWKFWFPLCFTALEGYRTYRLRFPDYGMDIRLFSGTDSMDIPPGKFLRMRITGQKED